MQTEDIETSESEGEGGIKLRAVNRRKVRRAAVAPIEEEQATTQFDPRVVLCPRCSAELKPCATGSEAGQCDVCSQFFEEQSLRSCVNDSFSICTGCWESKLEQQKAPTAERIASCLEELARSGTFCCNNGHEMRAVCQRHGGGQEPATSSAASSPSVRCSSCLKEVIRGLECPEGTALCVTCLAGVVEGAVRTQRPDDALARKFCGIKCCIHKKRATPATIAGIRQRLFDFHCLLCPELRHSATPQQASPSQTPTDAEEEEEEEEDTVEDGSSSTAGPEPLADGDVIVLCSAPGCNFMLCNRCAEFVRHTRITARSAQPTGMPLNLGVVFSKTKALYCSACGLYREQMHDRILASLGDERASYYLCLGCARKGQLAPKEEDRDLEIYQRWRAFALKQSILFEKNFPARSILDVHQLDLSDAAFRQLEVVIHRERAMPIPIVYETERLTTNEALCPLVRVLLQRARWPLHTTLRLLKLSQEAQLRYPETEGVWAGQVEKIKEVAIGMLDSLDRPEFLRRVILNPRPREAEPPKSVLSLAVEAGAGAREFLAHRSTQLALMTKWVSPIRNDESFSSAGFVQTRLLLWILGLWFSIVRRIAGSRVKKSLKSIQQRQNRPILTAFLFQEHENQLEYYAVSPQSAFLFYIVAFACFVFLVSFNAMQISTATFTTTEALILVWIVGLGFVEFSQLRELGVSYFSSFWNVFDLSHIAIWAAVLAVKLAATTKDTTTTQYSSLLEAYDCLLSIGVMLTWLRFLYVLLPSATLGPILVSFGSMLEDVVIWMEIVLVILFAVAIALLKLFVPPLVPTSVNSTVASLSQTTLGSSSSTSSGSDTPFHPRSWGNIFTSLIWGMTNLPDISGGSYAYLNNELLSRGRWVVTKIMIVLFMVLVIIIGLSLLIAIMNSTYTRITDSSESQHKAGFASIVDTFCESSPIPPPLNIITSILTPILHLTFRILRALPQFCCSCCSCVEIRHTSPFSNPEPGRLSRAIHDHSHIFLFQQRLYRAKAAESALRFKLRPFLSKLHDEASDVDSLKSQVVEIQQRVAELREAISTT